MKQMKHKKNVAYHWDTSIISRNDIRIDYIYEPTRPGSETYPSEKRTKTATE
ncbi:hypothetical protein RWE15_07305 [Virgibacillus halophilus]|uniref:Uncharacterized protein n=1 Tax=Tigheibacillus halophilus TaxID=361280 RepID=A0ABU5C4R2_9BACI|nr:hypothetical protein [Virgibacillus halophilus]